MKNPLTSPGRSARRGIDRMLDLLSVGPIGILVFAASVALLVQLQTGLQGSIRAEAVATAERVEHPALVSSFVASVYVELGDRIEVGAPLVDLSPFFIDRELTRLDTEIEKLLHESQLAQAGLLVEEQRWLSPELRLLPDRPSLQEPMEALYSQELVVMHTRRRQLLEDREGLTIRASETGRVTLVSALGSSVALGGSVASVSPEYARELVAYMPADTQPESISVGAPVEIARTGLDCDGDASVLRRGAEVVEAPGQLRNFLRFPVYGLPVYISIPKHCRLGVGQLLTIELPRAVI